MYISIRSNVCLAGTAFNTSYWSMFQGHKPGSSQYAPLQLDRFGDHYDFVVSLYSSSSQYFETSRMRLSSASSSPVGNSFISLSLCSTMASKAR